MGWNDVEYRQRPNGEVIKIRKGPGLLVMIVGLFIALMLAVACMSFVTSGDGEGCDVSATFSC